MVWTTYHIPVLFWFPDRFTVFWDVDWSGTVYSKAGIVHADSLDVYDHATRDALQCRVKHGGTWASTPNTNVGLSTNGNVYAPDGSVTPFDGTVGATTGRSPLRIGYSTATDPITYTQMGFRQLLIFNKELSQAEVNDVLRVMFPA